jgi:hypothetical protein
LAQHKGLPAPLIFFRASEMENPMKKRQKVLAVLIVVVGGVLFYWAASRVWYFALETIDLVENRTGLLVVLAATGAFYALVLVPVFVVLLRGDPLGQGFSWITGFFVTMAILIMGPALLKAVNGLNLTTAVTLLLAATAAPWVLRFAGMRRWKSKHHPPS